VLATGIFEPGQVNRGLNQRIKKRVPIFEHQKKISGRPSIGDIESGDQALKYAGWKVAATPTTGRYVVNNYANMLNENGHCITGTAIKEARLNLEVESPEEEQVEWTQNEEEPTFQVHFAGLLKDLVRECIVDKLMPCISDTLPFAMDGMIRDEFDYGKVERVLMNLVGDIHAHRESRLTAVLEGASKVEARMKLRTQHNRKDYPTLSCYEISFHDPGVRGNLLQDLYAYNREVTDSSTMSFDFRNNVSAALVMIPQSSHLEAMKYNNCRHNYVAEIINSLDKDGTRPEETRTDFLTMLARSDDCREHFQEVAQSKGLSSIERLGEEKSFAIQSDSNLNYTQMRALSQNLLAAVGTPIFSGEKKT
jgi:hypothetical protein